MVDFIGTSQKKAGVCDLDPDRAAAMTRILDVIGRPKVRLSNYGADLMLERKLNGRHYTIVLSWNDVRETYTFKSAPFKGANEVASLLRQKDARKNKGPLQKSEPSMDGVVTYPSSPDFAGLHDAQHRRSVSGGHQPSFDGPVSVRTRLFFIKSITKSTHPESPWELVKEHKRLVAVLRSPAHEYDLEEADKQEKELEEYEGELARKRIGLAIIALDLPYQGSPQALGVEDGFSNVTNVSVACTTPTAQAIPTLSEWSQLLLALMVMTVIGWHFHRERSY